MTTTPSLQEQLRWLEKTESDDRERILKWIVVFSIDAQNNQNNPSYMKDLKSFAPWVIANLRYKGYSWLDADLSFPRRIVTSSTIVSYAAGQLIYALMTDEVPNGDFMRECYSLYKLMGVADGVRKESLKLPSSSRSRGSVRHSELKKALIAAKDSLIANKAAPSLAKMDKAKTKKWAHKTAIRLISQYTLG